MSTFTLTMLDDGRMILSTERALGREQATRIRDAFVEWRDTPNGIMVIGECVVNKLGAVDVELDVDGPSEAEIRHERLMNSPYERELADERARYAALRAAQADPLNCSNCGEPLATHVECGEFG